AIERSLHFASNRGCELCHTLGDIFYTAGQAGRATALPSIGDETWAYPEDHTAAAADPLSGVAARRYSGTSRSNSASTRASCPERACSSSSSIERAMTA